MALAETVEGTGKLIDVSRENGSYSYTVTSTDKDEDSEPVTVQFQVTVDYVEERWSRKWYALTEEAVTAYIAANLSLTFEANCVNEKIGAWEIIRRYINRVVTSVSVTGVPGGD
jgi:hypothetical protein